MSNMLVNTVFPSRGWEGGEERRQGKHEIEEDKYGKGGLELQAKARKTSLWL